jgi:hypothetical protein
MLVAVWSPKGGSGTSVVAAGLALEAAHGGPVRIVDLDGDQAAIFGLAADPEHGLGTWFAAAPDVAPDALEELSSPAPGGVELIGPGSEPIGVPGSNAVTHLAAVLRDGPALTVVDAGDIRTSAARLLVEAADISLVVIRGCYLALRRGVHEPLVAAATAIVAVEQSARPLRAREIADVLQRPVLASVPDLPEIARVVDAGVLPMRPPLALVDPIATLVRRLDLGTWGQVA